MSGTHTTTPTATDEDNLKVDEITIPFTDVSFWNEYLVGALRIIVNLFVALVLGVLFWLVIWAVTKLIDKVVHLKAARSKTPLDPQQEQLLAFVIGGVKLLLWVQVIPILVGTVGIAADSIITILGALTLGLGLSLKPLAENFVMGVTLTVVKPFSVGDLVQIAGKVKGKVVKMLFAYTIVSEPDGTTVFVPNSKIAFGPIANLTDNPKARLDVGSFHLSHNANLGMSRQVMISAVLNVPGVLPDPAPQLIVEEVTQTAVVVACRVWVDSQKQLAISFPIREAILQQFKDSAIPLATWSADVAGTVRKLAQQGYPGLAGPRAAPVWPGGPGPGDRAGDEEGDELAAASLM